MKQNKNELRLLVHVSVFKKLKGSPHKSRRSSSVPKKNRHYTTTINRGNVEIVSHKIYLPAPSELPKGKRKERIQPKSNFELVQKEANKIFKKYKQSKQDDITVTAQIFKGKVTNWYRGTVEGKTSKGASFSALKKQLVKRRVEKTNALRKRKGFPKMLDEKKELESEYKNKLVDVAEEIDALALSAYTPKGEPEELPELKKIHVDGYYYSRRLRSKETGRFYTKRIHVNEYDYYREIGE